MAAHELDKRIEDTTKESLAATERIVAIAEETHQTADKIVVNLEHQGEKIEHFRRNVEEVHEDVHEVRRDISKLGWFSCCFWPFCLRGKPKNHSANTYSDEIGQKTLAEGPIIKRITNDRNEDKIEENLRKTAEIVEELREEAVLIGIEVDRQNEVLPDVINIAEETDKELTKGIRELKQH